MSFAPAVSLPPGPRLQRLLDGVKASTDIIWSFVDQALVSGSNFLIGVAAARLLHLAGFGRFAFVLVTAILVGTVQYFMTTAPLLARARTGPRLLAAQAVMIIGFSLLGGLFVATLVGALMLFRDGHVEPLLLAVSAFVALGQNLHDGARYLLFSQRKGLYAIALDATRYGTLALIIAGLALSRQTVTPQGLLTVIGCCALLPGLAALLPYALKARRLSRLLPVITASNWRSARWLVLMVLVTTSLDQITYMATAATLGDEAVGALRIGLYCTGLYGLLLVTLEKIVPRRAGEALRRGGDAELRRFLTRAAIYAGVPSLALMLGFAVPAAFWLELVFGKGAGAHAVLMQWATLGFFFVFVREFAMVYLRTVGETRPIFLSFSVSTSIALLGLWPAGHLFGLPGLAAMLTLGHAISAILIVVAAKRH